MSKVAEKSLVNNFLALLQRAFSSSNFGLRGITHGMLKLLINPEVKSAYFSEYIKVAEELRICLLRSRHVRENRSSRLHKVRGSEEELLTLGQLSFFGELSAQENGLVPLEHEYFLSEKFVFGSKFKGKTNELLIKLLINISKFIV